ncbi:LuxR family transcriptional regulator, partial [Vibrio cholerae]|nr:LuxR family transcriptional regulator [Vibrio cholerae]
FFLFFFFLESSDPNRSALLSKRVPVVLSLTALGRRQADISIALGVSPRIIFNHLRNARLILGGATTADSISIAIQRGDI